jgi:hypothetical protein
MAKKKKNSEVKCSWKIPVAQELMIMITRAAVFDSSVESDAGGNSSNPSPSAIARAKKRNLKLKYRFINMCIRRFADQERWLG